jgi:hypothetical protein
VSRNVMHIIDMIGLAGALWFVAHWNWTKILLGIFVALIGGFLPSYNIPQNEGPGETVISLPEKKFSIKGGVRFAIIAIGSVLVLAGVFEGG